MQDQIFIEYSNFLELIAYGIAFLSIVLLLLFVTINLKILQQFSLKRFQKTNDSLSELLVYASVIDDGIVLCKNGSMLAAWTYSAPDVASTSLAEIDKLSEDLNRLFVPLDKGFMIHIDALRVKEPEYFQKAFCFFPDRVSAAIDEVRRRFFSNQDPMYDVVFVISLTYFPPSNAVSKVQEAMLTKDEDKKDKNQKTLDVIDKFKGEVARFENALNVCFTDVARLGAYTKDNLDGTSIVYDSLLSWLQFCITGERNSIKLNDTPIYLNHVLGGVPFRTGVIPRMGKKYIRCVSLDNLPASTSAGVFNILSEIGCEYRWSSRFIFIERHEAIARFNKLRRMWKQKERGFFAQIFNLPTTKINYTAVEMVGETDLALSEIEKGNTAFGYYTSTIVLMSEDLEYINKAIDYIVNITRGELGIVARVEDINTTEAFLGSLPGHGNENLNNLLISTLNFADLLPVNTPYSGEMMAPCDFYEPNSPALMKTVSGRALTSPFYLNLHVGDLGHTLIFGPTGSGKSTLLTALEAQLLRYKNMSLFAFDKGMSMFALNQACGGLHFNPGADDSSLAFCPLSIIEEPSDLAWASGWIESILLLNVPEFSVTPAMRTAINVALEQMYQTKKIDKESEMTLSVFCSLVQSDEVRDILREYTTNGTYGYLFDAKKDGLTLSNFVVFEIEELMNLGTKYSVPILTYLFKVIAKSLHGQPACIVLDEAWIVFQDSTFKKQLKDWLKVLRKANCAVIIATQSLADAVGSGILSDLIENTATKIFLPNPSARQDETKKTYKLFGLNEVQIDAIATGQRKRDYIYFNMNQKCRKFQLGLSKFELAFFGASDKATIATIKKLMAEDKEHWVDNYLKLQGLEFPDNL